MPKRDDNLLIVLLAVAAILAIMWLGWLAMRPIPAAAATIEATPVVRCTVGDDNQRFLSWTGFIEAGFTEPIQAVIIYGGDLWVPIQIGPADGSLLLGQEEVWWKVEMIGLSGDCEDRLVFLPVVQSNH